jgi:hypothetical protein
MPPGLYELVIDGTGVRRRVDLRDGGARDVDVDLPWARTVAVYVDGPRGYAVVRAQTETRLLHASVDRDRRAHVRLPADEALLWVEARAPRPDGGGETVSERVAVDPGATLVRLTLERGPRTSGRVLDAAGTPVPHAVLRVTDRDGALVATLDCDADGAWAIAAAGRDALDVRWEGLVRRKVSTRYVGEEAAVLGVPAGTEGVVLRGQPAEARATLRARVVDAAGEPVAGAYVRVAPFRAQFLLTDAEGRIVVEGLPARAAELSGCCRTAPGSSLPRRRPAARRS